MVSKNDESQFLHNMIHHFLPPSTTVPYSDPMHMYPYRTPPKSEPTSPTLPYRTSTPPHFTPILYISYPTQLYTSTLSLPYHTLTLPLPFPTWALLLPYPTPILSRPNPYPSTDNMVEIDYLTRTLPRPTLAVDPIVSPRMIYLLDTFFVFFAVFCELFTTGP